MSENRAKIIVHRLDDGRFGVSVICGDQLTAQAVAQLFARRIGNAVESGDLVTTNPPPSPELN